MASSSSFMSYYRRDNGSGLEIAAHATARNANRLGSMANPIEAALYTNMLV
jgi:hypothetical protein